MRTPATLRSLRVRIVLCSLLLLAAAGVFFVLLDRPFRLAMQDFPPFQRPSMPETKNFTWQISLGKSGGSGGESSGQQPLVAVNASSSALVDPNHRHAVVELNFRCRLSDPKNAADSSEQGVSLDVSTPPAGGISFGPMETRVINRGSATGLRITPPAIVGTTAKAGDPIVIHIGFTGTGYAQGLSASADSFVELVATPIAATLVRPSPN